MVNFPAKKLRKNTVLKIRMRRFFFFLKKKVYIVNKQNLAIRFLLVLSSTISKQVNKVKYSVSVSTFIVLQYTLNKSQKFHT